LQHIPLLVAAMLQQLPWSFLSPWPAGTHTHVPSVEMPEQHAVPGFPSSPWPTAAHAQCPLTTEPLQHVELAAPTASQQVPSFESIEQQAEPVPGLPDATHGGALSCPASEPLLLLLLLPWVPELLLDPALLPWVPELLLDLEPLPWPMSGWVCIIDASVPASPFGGSFVLASGADVDASPERTPSTSTPHATSDTTHIARNSQVARSLTTAP
jgi:hypothetical protein